MPINAPYPGTYNYLLPPGPTNGVFPYGYSAGNIIENESGGLLKQNILMVNFNTRFSRKVSLQGNYQYTHANDLPGTPTNPYNFLQDWGTSSLNRRSNLIGHRVHSGAGQNHHRPHHCGALRRTRTMCRWARISMAIILHGARAVCARRRRLRRERRGLHAAWQLQHQLHGPAERHGDSG